MPVVSPGTAWIDFERVVTSNSFRHSRRLIVIVRMRLLIALAHIVGVASHFQGVLFNVLQSYFSDIVMPFSFYFLLCADEQWLPTLRRWEVKWAAMILLPSIAETCQYFAIRDRSINRMSLKNSKCRVNVVFTTWSYEAKLPIL